MSEGSISTIGLDPALQAEERLAMQQKMTFLQDQMERMSNQLELLLSSMATPPAPTPTPPVPPVPPASPVSPAPPAHTEVTIDEKFDPSSKAGSAYWKTATEPLANKYGGTPKETHAFLTSVRLRSDHLLWGRYFKFNVGDTTKDLLSDYGNIPIETIQEVHRDRIERATIESAAANDVAETKMIFYFIYESLEAAMQRKLSSHIAPMSYDGPTLLATILSLIYVSSDAAIDNLRDTMTSLHLKKYKWNVKNMNQAVRETVAQLEAVGYSETQNSIRFQLIRGYKTATNHEFHNFIHFLQNLWSEGKIKNILDLMARTDAKYDELVRDGTWKDKEIVPKQSTKPEVIALTAGLKSALNGTSKGESNKTANKKTAKHPDWKFDRSLSTTTTLKRGDQTYHWCDGKGEKNHKPMWTVHKPADCRVLSKTENKNNAGTNNNNNKNNGNGNKNALDPKAALTAVLSQMSLPQGRDPADCVDAFLAILNA